MNLDDRARAREIDRGDMLSEIDRLPQQLLEAWELAHSLELPDWRGLQRVLIAGMGGSAIGADLLIAYVQPIARLPLFLHRDYDLPGWARGSDTLVILSSHSGNTEETLTAFHAALKNECRLLAVTTNGKLAQEARAAGVPLWTFSHRGQPRAAIGFSFGLLLACITRLRLIPDVNDELRLAVQAMNAQQEHLKIDIPTVRNPAKRMAGQLLDRWVTVLAAGHLAPVARRWKGQINELAKAWAHFETLPEASHNTLTGVYHPEHLLHHTMVLFLRSAGDHPRNRLRLDLMRRVLMLEGLGTDVIDAQGETRLAQMWTCLHLGDYTAYYLAIAYGMDPTPIPPIENLKQEMGDVASVPKY